MDRWAAIRRVAKRTLEDYERRTGRRSFTPERGPHGILEHLVERCFRLTVAEDPDLGDNVSGKLDQDEETILVRPGLPQTRRTLVIAHELGHGALGHPLRQVEDRDEDIDEAPHVGALTERDGVYRAYSERDRWELEANVFALELLAPVHRVREMVLADPNWTVAGLAAYFGLSRSAMLNQLAAALLPGPIPEPEHRPSRTLPPMDPGQTDAATARTPALVLAGPGAGKTRVLTERFRFLVAEGADPRRILALTFNNKAAEEMRERLSALLPDEAHVLRVATYHSLGLDLLQAYGEHIGLKSSPQLLTPMDAFVFLRRRLAEVPLGDFEDLHRPTRHLKLLLTAISRAKDELVDPPAYMRLVQRWQEELAIRVASSDPATAEALDNEQREAARCGDVAAVYVLYQQWLRDEGYLDYGDLISVAVRLFDRTDVAKAIRAEYDHILVDEFQDINYASGRLVHSLDGGRGIVWAVGDPRQSIYRFRGASPLNLRNFTTDYPGATLIPLEWNYRSVEDIVRAGQAVEIPLPSSGQPLPVPTLLAHRGRPSAEPAVEVIAAPTGPDELAAIVQEVMKFADLMPRQEIAVLCRTRTRAQAVSDVLEASGVPTNWGGALPERPAFKDLMGVLLLATDHPLGLERLARIPEHYLSEVDLRILLLEARSRGRSAQAALYAASNGELEGLSEAGQALAARLKRLAGSLQHQPTPWHALAAYLFEHAGWPRTLFRDTSPASQRCLATWGQVADLAREFGVRATLAGGTDTATFVEFVQSSLEAGELGNANEVVAIADAVNVLTVHQSKGLEWPAVIICHVADGQFPIGEKHESLPLPPGMLSGQDSDDPAQEEACLFYVGVTRARDHLVLTRALRYGNRQPAASPYLGGLIRVLEPVGYLRQTTAPSVPSTGEANGATTANGWALPDVLPHRALQTYEDCPRRFMYEYVYGLRDDDTGYRQFHQALYATLSWLAEKVAAGELPAAEALTTEFQTRWEDIGPRDHPFEPMYRRRAQAVLASVRRRLKPGAQVRFRTQELIHIGGIAISVTIDEVEEGAERIFRRHQLGKPADSHKDDKLLRIMSAALNAQKGTHPSSVRLHYPVADVEEEAAPTDRKVTNWIDKIEQLTNAIARGEFPAKPSTMRCPTCPFYLTCSG